MKSIKLKRTSDKNGHIWNFSRVGGVNRVNLEKGKDLICLEDLDQKLWTALSCPVYGLELDFKTLELIDTDNDGRIRIPEIIEAVKWLTSLIKNQDELLEEREYLELSSINDSTEEGKNLLESAKQILKNLGKADADRLTVEDTSDTVKIFKDTKFNGDGIITEDSADDEVVKKLISEIVSCQGSQTDRNGKEGISIKHIDDFYHACGEYSDWYSKMETDSKKILPFGDATQKSFDAFQAVKAKVEDYFLRCRLTEFDPDSSGVLNSLKARYEEISAKDLSLNIDYIASFPLSGINHGILSLVKGVNPAWEKPVTIFKELVINVLYPGKDSITEEELKNINKVFEEYITWQAQKKGASVEELGLSRIREISNSSTREGLALLIEKEKDHESNADNIILVDKLVRYYRDVFKLLRNYVTFYDFYSPDRYAIFQAGKLYFDQRCCELCMIVKDMSKHNSLARTSGLCLIYCECTSRKGNEKMTVVAALTDGDFDNIDVGRNGLFYDRKGNDWDATIIKVIDNPISIRQAFWSPYRKVSKFISNQIEKFASEKEKEVDTMASSGVEKASGHVDAGLKESVGSAPAQTKPAVAAAAPFDIGKFVGIFAALSLALGAIGSVLASIFTGFLSLVWWKIPLAFLGIILVISGPSMIIAWLKLRKRNLAPLLDANGWAVNARAIINISFGATLTQLAMLPENSKLNLADPFAKKRNPWIPFFIFILIVAVTAYLLWNFGFLSKWGII